MALVKFAVPKVAQDRSNSCWYAAACMVAFYREAGPRLGLPEVYALNNGINPNEFSLLAKNEGLLPVAIPKTWSPDQMKAILETNGPLWCAGDWYGANHIIVITGVDTTACEIYLNDPDGGVAKKQSVAWFIKHLAKITDAILYHPPV